MTDRKISNRIFGTLGVIILLTMLNNSILDSSTFMYVLYLIEIIFIIYLFHLVIKFEFSIINNNSVLVCFSVLFFSFLLSTEPVYSNLLKYIGYLLSVNVGMALAFRRKQIKPSNIVLFSIIITPLILVLLFDKTINKCLFFPASNTLVFWGLCVSLLYFKCKGDNSIIKCGIILLAYVFTGSTLGVIVALALSIVFLNRKNVKLISITLLLSLILLLMIMYSDFSIFKRIRNVIDVFNTMTINDWKNLRDVDLYTLQSLNAVEEGERGDNTSAIWRFQHWLILIDDYLKYWYYSFFVGLGDNYSKMETGLKPHNDYLRITIEYGLIVLFIVLSWLIKTYRVLKRKRIIYFILPAFIYFSTENLIDSFPANCILFLCIGHSLYEEKMTPLECNVSEKQTVSCNF